MSKIIILQRKVIATAASAALAFSMIAAVPGSAFATATAISATSAAASVNIGSTVDMSNYVTASGLDTTAQHIDYAITNTSTDTGTATVNKHSGVLTPSAVGTVTVTAYLVNQAQQSGFKTTPCVSTTLLATKQVTINNGSGYGYQGGTLQILMTSFSPAVDTTTTTSTHYYNTLSNVTASNNTVTLNYSQNYGIGSNGIASYQTTNKDNVSLTNSSGTVVGTLNTGSIMSLGQQGTSKTNLTLSINVEDLASGTYTLTFGSSYVAGNGTSTLGTPVSFTFAI